MYETYEYLCTQISIFGSLPTHKVFVNAERNRTKLVFADNTYMYSTVSDWALNHSGLDSREKLWPQEPNIFLENEKKRLSLYRLSHPYFETEKADH